MLKIMVLFNMCELSQINISVPVQQLSQAQSWGKILHWLVGGIHLLGHPFAYRVPFIGL